MRWAPSDYHADEHVKLLKARRDYRTLSFYRHFLDFSFMAGGDLPADPEALAAAVEMPRKDVEHALSFCIGRLITQDGERLFQKRVRRDVVAEFEFRAEQGEHGKKGGRPKKEREALRDEKGMVSESKTPPAPAPKPFPAPAPDARFQSTAPANPLIAGRRPELESECLALVRETASLTDEDPVEVIALASGYRGASTTKLNPASMSDDRLANTVRDLRRDLAEIKRRQADGRPLR
jgi:uncharacterized protein YdaU (DUF1376 family)